MGPRSSPSKSSNPTPDRKEFRKSLEQTSFQNPAPTSSVAAAVRLSIPRSQPVPIDAKPPPLQLQSIHPDLSSSTPSRLSVKDLVNQIECIDKGPRSRSSTLPNPNSPYKVSHADSEVSTAFTIFSEPPVGRPEPLSELTSLLICSGPYDKLISKEYIKSASSSLANSPQSLASDSLNNFLYEAPPTDPATVSNGLTTPTIWPFSGLSSSEDKLDGPSEPENDDGLNESMVTDSPPGKLSEYEMSQEVAEDLEPPSISKKAAKKRKLFRLFRKSKSSDKHSKSSNAKIRSKSDMSPNVIRSGANPQFKVRSMSENDEGRSLRRSYTLLTADITAKYAKKKHSHLIEAKISEYATANGTHHSPPSASSELVATAQLVATPPAELSAESFQKSLYCNQLKYKLRSAMQNIHTPLSVGPVELCQRTGECDTRYQLILLTQHALQRSRWKQDSMEMALLTEILNMVEPLSNEL